MYSAASNNMKLLHRLLLGGLLFYYQYDSNNNKTTTLTKKHTKLNRTLCRKFIHEFFITAFKLNTQQFKVKQFLTYREIIRMSVVLNNFMNSLLECS